MSEHHSSVTGKNATSWPFDSIMLAATMGSLFGLWSAGIIDSISGSLDVLQVKWVWFPYVLPFLLGAAWLASMLLIRFVARAPWLSGRVAQQSPDSVQG